MNLVEAHIAYGLAWVSFGLGHSILASATVKSKLEPKLGPYYRITYNVIASIHIFVVWLLGIWVFKGADTFEIQNSILTSLSALSVLGIIIMVLALREYDLGLLTGTAQIKNHKLGNTDLDIEPLNTIGLHSYVRHPIYLGAYLLLLGNAQNEHGMATAIWGSIYLLVGTHYEERYLTNLYGSAYREYQDKVPSIIPWRGKVNQPTSH